MCINVIQRTKGFVTNGQYMHNCRREAALSVALTDSVRMLRRRSSAINQPERSPLIVQATTLELSEHVEEAVLIVTGVRREDRRLRVKRNVNLNI